MNNYTGQLDGNSLTIDNEPIPDGELELAKNENKYLVKNSKSVYLLVKEKYKTNKGDIFIEQQCNYSPAKGNLVFQNNKPVPDGKYRIGFMKHIIVENGKIIKD